MKKAFAVLFLTGALGTMCADIIYEQPSVYGAHGYVGYGYTDEESSAGTGFRVFDNFSLSAAGEINEVSWVGLYIDGSIYQNKAPNTTSWDISFFADHSGTPGASLADTTLSAAQVDSQILGTGLFGGVSFTIYQFTADIPTFDAAAGTTYWFSPFSHNPDETTKFIWADGTGGTNTALSERLSSGSVTNSYPNLTDRGFDLSNVPEPSTWLLALTAPIGLAFRRIRMRTPAGQRP